MGRLVLAVKKEWRTAADCLKFWSLDYTKVSDPDPHYYVDPDPGPNFSPFGSGSRNTKKIYKNCIIKVFPVCTSILKINTNIGLNLLLSNKNISIWPQIWAFQGSGSRGQRTEGDTSKPPRGRPRSRCRATSSPLGTRTKYLAPSLSHRLPTDWERRRSQGKQSKAAQTRRGEPARRLGPGPPCWGQHQRQRRES